MSHEMKASESYDKNHFRQLFMNFIENSKTDPTKLFKGIKIKLSGFCAIDLDCLKNQAIKHFTINLVEIFNK